MGEVFVLRIRPRVGRRENTFDVRRIEIDGESIKLELDDHGEHVWVCHEPDRVLSSLRELPGPVVAVPMEHLLWVGDECFACEEPPASSEQHNRT